MRLETKRKFLIATGDPKVFQSLSSYVERHFKLSHCLRAKDGSDAIMKIQNDPPEVVITDLHLAKTDGIGLTNWILKNRFCAKVAVVILSPFPELEQFVDAVVTGQVQFLNPKSGEAAHSKALTRALNFVSHSEPREFYLKFLAPGDQLIRKGDKADFVYLVKTGNLVARATATNGEVITLGRITSGEFVGEMAYINGEMRSADVFSESDCELIEIPVQVLDHVLFSKPSWSKALMATLSKRVKRANDGHIKKAATSA